MWLSVRAACVAAGLIGRATILEPGERLVEVADKAFGRDITRFLNVAASVGCTRQAIEEAANRLDAVHACFGITAPCRQGALVVSTDLALTVAALSRRVGSVILRDRPPVVTWDQLFSCGVAIAEPIGDSSPASEALREQLNLAPLPQPIRIDSRVRVRSKPVVVPSGCDQ
jgi:hypothetical protein